MEKEYYKDYEIVRITRFSDGIGYAAGVNFNAGYPWAVFLFVEENDQKTYICGDYFTRQEAAVAIPNYNDKVKRHKIENPGAEIRLVYFSSFDEKEV